MIERKTSMILVATILAGTILSGTTAMDTSDLGSQTALDEELIIKFVCINTQHEQI